MFGWYNDKGKPAQKRVTLDCSKDELLTEQSHKKEVDINNIIKKHGMDLIRKTAAMQSQDYRFDDVTGNDFQEAQMIIAKAQSSFENMPAEIRKRFENNAAKFLDFVQNPDNQSEMVNLGLVPKPEPAPAPAPDPVPDPAPTTETPPV